MGENIFSSREELTSNDKLNEENLLPDGFESLTSFAHEWGNIDNQTERYLKRQSSKFEKLQQFHSVASPLLESVFQHLDSFTYGENLPEKEARLFRIMLGLIEAAQAVEIFNTPRVPHTPYPHTSFKLEEL